DNVDVLTSSRMPTFTYTAPVNPTDYARNNVSPTWYTAPPSLPGDYLNAAEQTKLAFLDAAVSSRSTYAGGPVASVTGSVGSVTSPVVASSVTGSVGSVTGSVGSISGITFPGNFGTFAVDPSGRVTLVPGQSVVASNLPADYQQRGIAVTLPATAPTGYGGTGTDTPGTTLLVARIPGTIQPQSGDAYARLGSPAGATLSADIAAVKADTGGLVTNVAALPAAVWVYTASDGLTHQQSDALRTAVLLRAFSVSYNVSTRTQVTNYFKADGATALATTTVVYDATGRAASRTTAFTNLP
ncbi:hypothetical protein, partial [Janthinobacterium sp.]|uniref:hypothetical protein n=1 Tax=Janthinobacterium sp. TaxID=1871054 RepID=UPI0039775441